MPKVYSATDAASVTAVVRASSIIRALYATGITAAMTDTPYATGVTGAVSGAPHAIGATETAADATVLR